LEHEESEFYPEGFTLFYSFKIRELRDQVILKSRHDLNYLKILTT
jgi:hypothetical protein